MGFKDAVLFITREGLHMLPQLLKLLASASKCVLESLCFPSCICNRVDLGSRKSPRDHVNGPENNAA